MTLPPLPLLPHVPENPTPLQRQVADEPAVEQKIVTKTVVEPKDYCEAPAVEQKTVIDRKTVVELKDTKTAIEPKAITKVVMRMERRSSTAMQRQVADHLCLKGGWWS